MGAVGQVVPLYASVTNDATVARAVDDASVVVSLVGILAERRRGDFESIHHEGAARIARLAASAGADALVHISALGADPASPSLYASSKGRGEAAVRDGFAAATVFRPSVVFGPEDQFFNRFGAMAQYLWVMPVIAGDTRFQPVCVSDVADAVMAAIERPDAAGAVYELGGPKTLRFREILEYVLLETRRSRPLVTVPMGLIRLAAAILERLPGRLLTRDQLLLLARDNVVSPGVPGLPELGIVPTPIELVVPRYLRRFRPGGGKREILPHELKGASSDLSP
jgi:NADH dehydrogenase